MPLPLRVVEPVFLSRGTLPDQVSVPNDLEAVSNGTLANVIRQLSSLSHNAGEIYGELIRVGTEIANRAGNLQARIDRLAVKVSQLDNAQDEVNSMQDALNTKPFQSSMVFDQQVVARESLNFGMTKIYQLCDKPPPLDKLNKYRDDGKDGLKFYTDANYFFELWRQDMLKDHERAMFDKVKKPHKPKHENGMRKQKRPRQPQSIRDKQRHLVLENGDAGLNQNMLADTPDGMTPTYSPGGVNYQYQQAAMNGNIPNGRPINGIDYNQQTQAHNGQIYNNEMNNGYRQSPTRVQTNHYEAYTNQVNQQSHIGHYQQQQQQLYYQHQQQQINTPPPPYESPTTYARQTSTPGSVAVNNVAPSANSPNVYGYRPVQPPPAPPPSYGGTPPSGTPTRAMRMNSREREVLPPPPPPPQEIQAVNGYQMSMSHTQMNGYGRMESHYQSRIQMQQTQSYNGGVNLPLPIPMIDDVDEPLPPPPPTPDQNLSELAMAISRLRPTLPEDQLPPSPPPPPPEDFSYTHQQAPPPPPPLPPPAPMMNANGMVGNIIKPPTPAKPAEKKRSGPAAATWDGRNELLKAIRDGIELRKVEKKKEPGKEDKPASAYLDVASILSRRVHLEMSDSDSGSGSEYDSDAWGEETCA